MELHGPKNLSEFDIRSVARFLELVATVQGRNISSPKPTSLMISEIGRGIIDKLIIKLHEGLLVEDVLKRCRDLGLETKIKCEKGKKYFLNIYHPNGLIIKCFLGKADRKEFYRIITNPSKVSSLAKTEHALLQVIGEIALISDIYRLDFTVDYYTAYATILEGLDVAYKHFQLGHLSSSKGRTGLQIGTDNDKISIYDKAAQLGLSTPLTRIERQITGPNVPVKTFKELRDSLAKILDLNPLSIVKLHHLNLADDRSLSASQLQKFYEFKTLIKHEGYFQARKKLYKTTNKNFHRDYGEFFSLIPYEVQPTDLLKDSLTKYFKEVLQ